ncbi:unnamed protein product [Arabidopsis thaliana]|uniref:(thale cress) hypothetical protein n=1 Tax=Arabidopsis thaliana TaxID=3702 RepID=A0A7G2F2Z6_ARATH|nr:unnamed protein product [Arabidopsis thaliana]
MSSFFPFIFLFLFSSLTSFRASAQDPRFLAYYCPNTTTYSSNSTYFTNLNTLLSSLSSRNASYSTGFQNATVGQALDRATGLFLCRGDFSPEVCRNCVTFAVNNTFRRCPNQREAVFYYEECILRYSHKNILSTAITNEGEFIMRNTNTISPIQNQINQFTNLVLSNMNQAAIEAADSSRKFSTIKNEWSALQTFYGLVQCTPDLSRQDCFSCLTSSINRMMPLFRIGARHFWPSCNSRYELYDFYNETAIGTPPPPLPPLASPSLPDKSGNSNVVVVAVVVPVIVVVLIFIAGYCFFAKRAKKTYGTTPALDEEDKTTIESLRLDYRAIQAATNDFSENNKIGRGGFGDVYKGTFSNGTEVAVKRLSKTSEQGDTEFKNEVVVVANLRHKNLVRILGFSIEREERILVYGYVENKSLDNFLFDDAQDLVTHAWRLWRNGTALDLVDPFIADSCRKSEVVRCIHIGLLCVQEDPVKRPAMSTISVMLTSNTMALPAPQQPGFFVRSRPGTNRLDSDQSTTNKSVTVSIDDSSMSDLDPR